VFPPSTRLQLALVVAAVGAATQLAVRGRGRLFGVPADSPTERDRGWAAGVRVGAAGIGLGCVVVVLGARDPRGVLSALAAGVLLPAAALALGRWRMAVRHAAPPPTEWWRLASVPLHLVNAATVAVGAALFAWLLPKLPSIVPLHWAVLGHGGYGSPTKLWWSLLPLSLNTGLLVLAARQLAGVCNHRRLALLRFTEVLLVGFDVAIVVVWLGAAASGRPELRVLRPALLLAGVVVAAALLGGLVASVSLRRPGRPQYERAQS